MAKVYTPFPDTLYCKMSGLVNNGALNCLDQPEAESYNDVEFELVHKGNGIYAEADSESENVNIGLKISGTAGYISVTHSGSGISSHYILGFHYLTVDGDVGYSDVYGVSANHLNDNDFSPACRDNSNSGEIDIYQYNESQVPSELTCLTATPATLQPPTALAAVSDDVDSIDLDWTNGSIEQKITLNWDASAGATGYEVKVDSEDYVDVGNVLTWDHTTCVSTTEHTYIVRPYNASGGGTTGTVDATWYDVSATGTHIYRSATLPSSPELAASWSAKTELTDSEPFTGDHLYEDTTVVSENSYYYAVWHTDANGDASETATAGPIPFGSTLAKPAMIVEADSISPPTIDSISLDSENGKVLLAYTAGDANFSYNLQWTPVDGATSYEIYHKISTTTWRHILTETTVFNIDVDRDTTYLEDMVAGEEQSFGVIAINSSNESEMATDKDTYYGLETYDIARDTTSGVDSDDNIATGETASPYEDDTVPSTGITFYYGVRSIDSNGDPTAYAEDSITIPERPTSLQATDGLYPDKVGVSWTPPAAADSYKVYRSNTNDVTTASQIGTATGTSYDDYNVDPNTIYYYWVKAVVDSEAEDSFFSEGDSGYPEGGGGGGGGGGDKGDGGDNYKNRRDIQNRHRVQQNKKPDRNDKYIDLPAKEVKRQVKRSSDLPTP